jgi:hypothetical protein
MKNHLAWLGLPARLMLDAESNVPCKLNYIDDIDDETQLFDYLILDLRN